MQPSVNGFEPRKFLWWDREDGEVCKLEDTAHDPTLNTMAKVVDEAWAGEGFDVVEDDGHSRASGFQHAKDAWKFQGEATSGPGERCILHQHPCIAPGSGLDLQRAQRLAPAVKLPGYAANLH